MSDSTPNSKSAAAKSAARRAALVADAHAATEAAEAMVSSPVREAMMHMADRRADLMTEENPHLAELRDEADALEVWCARRAVALARRDDPSSLVRRVDMVVASGWLGCGLVGARSRRDFRPGGDARAVVWLASR